MISISSSRRIDDDDDDGDDDDDDDDDLTKDCENCASALTTTAMLQEEHLEEMELALETVKNLAKTKDVAIIGPWQDIPEVRANEADAA